MSDLNFPESMLYLSKAAIIGIQFLNIGTLEEFKQLKDKSELKEPVVLNDIQHKRFKYLCPDISCRVPVGFFRFGEGFTRKYMYCPLCGQAINWDKINFDGEKIL